MKPVNLYPTAQQSADSGAPNMGLIGGAAAGIVLGVVVASFFALAHVDSIKSETGKLTSDASAAQTETQTVEAQIEAVGSPVIDSDKQLAANAESTLVSVYKNRVDFKLVASELQAIMAGTGGWYTTVDASSEGTVDTSSTSAATSVKIQGIMPTVQLAASMNERVESTRSFSNATATDVETVKMRKINGRKVGTYVKFTITATLVDTLAPYKDAGAGAGEGLVANGGGGDPELSLDPQPVIRKAARPSDKATAAAAAAASNPLALAATAALGGSK